MKCYAISLERSIERRVHIAAQLEGRVHELVDAVDARQLGPHELPPLPPAMPERFWPGVYACGLSHMNAYRAVVRDGGRGLVLEDDAVLPDNLETVLGALPDVDVALLYWRWHATKPGVPTCAAAYAIAPGAARRLLEFDPPARGLAPDAWSHFPVDVWVHPERPICVRVDFPSTVGYSSVGKFVPAWLRTWNRRRIERRMTRPAG